MRGLARVSLDRIRRAMATNNTPLLQASLLHVLNDGYKVAIVTLIPLVATAQDLSYTQAGFLGTVLTAMGTVMALPASVAAARLGDLRVLQIGVLLYALPLLLIGWTTKYLPLILLFGAAGIGFGLFHPVGSAWVAKVSSQQRMGRSLGLFIASGDIGKVVLPILMTLLLSRTCLTLASSALGILCILTITGSSLIHTHGQKCSTLPGVERSDSRVSVSTRPTRARLVLAITLGSLDSFVQEPMTLFIPFLILARGVSVGSVGLAVAIYSAGSFVGKSLLGHIADRKGDAVTLVVAKVGMAVLLVFLAWCDMPSAVLLVVLFLIGSLSEGTAPVINSMVGGSVPAGSYNLVFGTSGTFNALLGGLSSLFFGYVADRSRVESVFFANAVFVLFMIVLALCCRRAPSAQPRAIPSSDKED